MYERIGTVYDFVRNEIAFGYNASDELPVTGRLGGTGMAVALACAEWTMAALGLALIASARMRAIRPRAA